VVAPAADLRFDCDLNTPLENILSKQGQQSEKINQLYDCNSGLRTHLISCRVDHTCFPMCAIPSKKKTSLQMRSSFRDISLVEMSVGTFSRDPFDDRLKDSEI
jgi:hypothetical protein